MTTPDVAQQGQPSLSDLAALVDAATGPLDLLTALCALKTAVGNAERKAVARARDGGASWPQVAARLGTSKQAAAKKHGTKPQPAEPGAAGLSATERKPSRRSASWAVTTPGGRTLVRVQKHAGG